MRLKQTRIHDVNIFLHALPDGSKFQISLTDIERHHKVLSALGFSSQLNPGERLLPRPRGPVSLFNSEGRQDPQKDQKMIRCYRDGMIKDWHGHWHHVEIPYKRYPRVTIPAPGEELTVDVKDGKTVVVSRTLEYRPNDARQNEAIKHTINLFLELFGECDILSDELLQIHKFKIERRNWRVLPTGEYPWERAKDILKDITKSLSNAQRRLVDYRFRHISGFNPSKLIIGEAGFDGYVIFCFEDLNLYLLESRFTDNATYVFGEDWESLCQLTKAEILDEHLQKYRLVHRGGWPQKVAGLLNRRQKAA
ncbi:MAG: hypothetical protein BGO21_08605 [Dyadobacter sp. 50-39]|uniref:hypothetical protein n=1 Tax=Dyadobacter sp. 50-39 TaxID=1895756 RepID=UPI00096346B3|nr:hypothetical protein [Dyadobacter sp. 50-39]OJV19307.1 MAG: hypothetical protein BGO21_08605 [Dyadobacter sp. 50-39]